MARYPDSFIEEVRERVDLLELVGRHVNLKKNGVNWSGLCPFHSEKTPSFSVRPDKGFFKCFGCGTGGDAFKFIMKIKGLEFYEAIEELAASCGLPLPETRRESPETIREREERRQLLDLMNRVRAWFREQLAGPRGQPARDYLQHRGLTAETLQRFHIGYAPPGWSHLLDHFGGGEAAAMALEKVGLVTRRPEGGNRYDRFRDRIIFPIHDHQNRCVGFGGRLMGDGHPKYINSPETPLYHKGQLLYGLHLAQEAIQREGWVLVVEGYMDLLALSNRGINAVVATLGTALTGDHLHRLWRRSRRIHFCFDGDKAGRDAAWRALERVMDGLQADRHADFLFLPDGRDPDDMIRQEGEKAFRQRLREALSLTQLLTQRLSDGLDLNDPEGRAALVHRARPLLWRVADPLLRELYAQSIGQPFDIPADQVLGPAPNESSVGRNHPPPPGFPSPPPSEPPHGWPPPGTMAGRRSGAGERWSPRRLGAERAGGTPTHGLNIERTLLALILNFPPLFLEREEALSGQKLENPQLFRLLSELIELGAELDEESESWPLERISDTSLAALAQNILLETEETIERLSPEAVHAELDGCLKAIQGQQLDRQIDQTTREIGSGRGDLSRLMPMLRALQQERKLLLLSK